MANPTWPLLSGPSVSCWPDLAPAVRANCLLQARPVRAKCQLLARPGPCCQGQLSAAGQTWPLLSRFSVCYWPNLAPAARAKCLILAPAVRENCPLLARPGSCCQGQVSTIGQTYPLLSGPSVCCLPDLANPPVLVLPGHQAPLLRGACTMHMQEHEIMLLLYGTVG